MQVKTDNLQEWSFSLDGDSWLQSCVPANLNCSSGHSGPTPSAAKSQAAAQLSLASVERSGQSRLLTKSSVGGARVVCVCLLRYPALHASRMTPLELPVKCWHHGNASPSPIYAIVCPDMPSIHLINYKEWGASPEYQWYMKHTPCILPALSRPPSFEA